MIDWLVLWCLAPVISWLSVLLVEETVPGENHRPVASHWQTSSHLMHLVHLAWAGFGLTTLVVIDTEFTGSWKSNYHTITTKPASHHMIYYIPVYWQMIFSFLFFCVITFCDVFLFQPLQLPDTLIPEEYHIVKNKGVMGIEFHEEYV